MSKEAAAGRTPEEEALTEEIERTREQLGDTVEALAAKADVKARARHKAAEVTGMLRGKARTAKDKTAGQAAGLRNEARAATGKMAGQVPGLSDEAAIRAAAAAVAVVMLTIAWLALRRRRR